MAENILNNKNKQNIFTSIGKTLTATSLGLQGKDPSSVFDDLKDPSFSDLFHRMQVAEMIEPGSGAKMGRSYLGINDPIGVNNDNAISQAALSNNLSSKNVDVQQAMNNLGGGFDVVPKSFSQSRKNLLGTDTTTFDVLEPPLQKGERVGIEKGAEETAKQKASAQRSLPETELFINQFVRSKNELASVFPDIGDATIQGYFQRFSARRGVDADLFPETSALKTKKQVFANGAAREVEGGKVTDKDRKIYADALVSVIDNPDAENISLAASSLNTLYNKGGEVVPVLESYMNSGVDLLENIAIRAIENNYSTTSAKKMKIDVESIPSSLIDRIPVNILEKMVGE